MCLVFQNMSDIIQNMSDIFFIVNKSGFSTNGIENFWSHLKRMILGIYHKVSAKHLYWYCAECVYRYNTRCLNDGERFLFFIREAINQLRYKETTHQEMFAF